MTPAVEIIAMQFGCTPQQVKTKLAKNAAQGQKDNRGASWKSAPDFFKVEPDGTLTKFNSKAEAYKFSKQTKDPEIVKPDGWEYEATGNA